MIKIIFLFVLNVCTSFSQTYQMNVRMKNGTTTSIPVQDIWKLTFSNITDVGNEQLATVIKTFALLQNYPNPFNPSTTIEYQLPKLGNVEIRIFNVAGQLVKIFGNISQAEGTHSVVWDGKNNAGATVASGLYIYQVAFENSILSKKMLFIK